MRRVLSSTVAILSLAFASPAMAGFLATPWTSVSGYAYCIITNVGTAEATVTSLRATNQSGGQVSFNSNHCGPFPATLAPGATCYQTFALNVSLGCAFEFKGKVRASLEVISSTFQPVLVVPATAK